MLGDLRAFWRAWRSNLQDKADRAALGEMYETVQEDAKHIYPFWKAATGSDRYDRDSPELASLAAVGDTVNSTCPIAGQPVDGTVVVAHGEDQIGVCCKRCKATVEAWTDEAKTAYVTKMKAQGGQEVPATKPAAPRGRTRSPKTISPPRATSSGMVEAMIAASDASTVCMATKFSPR